MMFQLLIKCGLCIRIHHETYKEYNVERKEEQITLKWINLMTTSRSE